MLASVTDAVKGEFPGWRSHRTASEGAMKCRKNVEKIGGICDQLLDIIDDSREACDNDECELILCVVHDCVQKMRRVMADWNPEGLIDVGIRPVGIEEPAARTVN